MVPSMSTRLSAEAEFLQEAIDGDVRAIGTLISYLSSNNSDLRHIIQIALHDCVAIKPWRYLLRLMAVHKWGPGVTGRLDIAAKIPADHLTLARMEQTILEAFVVDENDDEIAAKEDVLRMGLADTDVRIRWSAAYILGLRGGEESVPHLHDMLIHGTLAEQLRAVEALSNVHSEHSGPALIRALEMRGTPVHHAAWRAINDLGRDIAPALIQALNHKDSHIRWHAARALGLIGDSRAVGTLAQGLCDENPAVRWASARALAELDSLAVPAILEQLACCHLDETLRQAALHALNSMPSRHTLEYLRPLFDALNSPAAYLQAPQEAQKLLNEWHTTV